MRRLNCPNTAARDARATWVPMHRCVPNPNATCGFGSRRMSNVNGSANTSSSRFADGYSRMIRSPRSTGWSPIRSSATARRKKLLSGVTHRSTSSTAPGTRSGSAAMASHCSGCRAKASRPWLIAVRVVSAPPAMNRPTSWTIVAGGSGSPSIVACSHTLIRSSPGSASFFGAISASTPTNSMLAAKNSRNTSPSRSRMSVRINRSDHDVICGHISSGKPRIRAVKRAGNCPASAPMTSISSPAASASSINSVTSSAISAWRWATDLPVSSGCTSMRCWRCRGSSWAIMLISSGDHSAR